MTDLTRYIVGYVRGRQPHSSGSIATRQKPHRAIKAINITVYMISASLDFHHSLDSHLLSHVGLCIHTTQFSYVWEACKHHVASVKQIGPVGKYAQHVYSMSL